MPDKPYPRHCTECSHTTVISRYITAYTVDAIVDGVLHAYVINNLPIDYCQLCGEIYYTNISSDAKSVALEEYLERRKTDVT